MPGCGADPISGSPFRASGAVDATRIVPKFSGSKLAPRVVCKTACGAGAAAHPRSESHADRPIRAPRHLSAGLGHRPMRLPLRLLHVGAHELSAQGGAAHPGGARSAVQRVRGLGRAQAPHHRRRAAGAEGRHRAVREPGPPPEERRARRADAHHQRQPTAAPCGTALCGGRAPGEHLPRHPRPREIRQDHPLGPARPGDGRHRCRPRRRAQDQDQHRGAARRQRG